MRIKAGHIILILLGATTLLTLYLVSFTARARGLDPLKEGAAPSIEESYDQAPVIDVETRTLDMGIIPRDGESQKTIRVYNRGVSRLEISNILSSCNLCTKGSFPPGKRVIEPGQYSDMIVQVFPAGIAGFVSVKTLSLINNDPRNPSLQISVKAIVDPEFELVPETFSFGEVEKGQQAEMAVIFRTLIDTPVALQAVSLTPDKNVSKDMAGITFTIEDVPETEWQVPGKTERRIRAVLSPEIQSGVFDMPVFVHTDLKRLPIYPTKAGGTIRAPYTIDFGTEENKIELRQQTPEAVLVLNSEHALSAVTARMESGKATVDLEQGTANSAQIRCRMDAMLKRGIHEDALILNIDCNGLSYVERIRVQIYAPGRPMEP